ncbi:HotDog domain-containing protein [Lipomyces kononenkoae]|uniref:HotDog domain-containing protein n=1 Tax=Lipomyces kononenkoae TaxID=34357 RepID=A0ACC3T7K4_LIPKO
MTTRSVVNCFARFGGRCKLIHGSTRSGQASRSSGFSTSTDASLTGRPSFLAQHAGTVIIATSSVLVGAGLAYNMPPLQILTMFQERLPEPGSVQEQAFIDRVENQLEQSRIVKQMRANPEFKEHRMWASIPDKYRNQSFLAGSLAGAGKFAVPGIVFVNDKTNECVSVVHVGSRLCGFPGIVHGGLIGALLDEALVRAAILPLPGKTAVTANLDIKYRAPTFTNQVIAIKAKVTDFTTNKSVVAAKVESAHGRLLAEGTGVFVVPKKFKLESLSGM